MVDIDMLGLTALVKEVTKVEEDKFTAGGIYVPKTVETNSSFVEAEVVKVGPGEESAHGKFIEPEFKVGDVIYLDRGFAKPFSVGNEDFLIVSARDVIAKKSV